MGFLAGFGKAFSSSFNAERDRIHQRQQDAFRVAYGEYERKRAQYEEDERAWKKAEETGKLMAERLGAPPEAGLMAAKWIVNGYTLDDVEEMMKTTKFSVAPEVSFNYSTPNPQSTNTENTSLEQTTDSLTNMPNPTEGGPNPNVTGPEGNNEGLLNNMFGDLFNTVGMSSAERAQHRLKTDAGIDQAQLDRVNAGFQQPDVPSNLSMSTSDTSVMSRLAEFGLAADDGGLIPNKVAAVKVEAEQWAKSGDPVLEAKAERFNALMPTIEIEMMKKIDPQTAVELMAALNPLNTPLQELSDGRTSARTLAAQGKDLVDQVIANPAILTTTAQGVAMFEAIRTESNAFIGLVNGILGQNQDPSEEQMLAAVDSFVNEQINAGKITQELAEGYRTFHAGIIRYVYNVGKALGQEGNGFSNKDFALIMSAVQSSNNAPAFINNIKKMSMDAFNAVQFKQDDMQRRTQIRILLDQPEIAPYLQFELEPLAKQYPDLYEWASTPYDGGNQNQPKVDAPVEGTVKVGKNGIQYMYQGGDPASPDSWKPMTDYR